ncbi:hypothetical protein QUG92_08455 [Curtobacterium sp. RHCKG23]|uniref:DUF4446 family protein n=1 Tax=Curtobacterium citri TaxID=3055139 RepID=A0ABT7T6G1_9MICO|nr:hypothetical protein [Curtobacterium citri]MDM7885135.1 hypothetical protein [Curtobacterium citri]
MLGKTIIAQTASVLALLVGILLTGDPRKLFENHLGVIFAIAAVIVAGIVFVVEVREALANRVRKFSGRSRDEKVKAFMVKLVEGGGHCVMSSNDLSWVDSEAEKVLKAKAKAGSLELLMPREVAKSKRLAAAGAKVHYYGDEDFKFKSRFTIVNAGRSDSYVAIGHGAHETHFIRIAGEKSDPAVSLADDLRRLAERHAKVSP